MGIVAEDRTSAAQSAISLKEALRAFRNWNSASIPVRVSFLGKAAASETVRVSMNGLVTLVDPQGMVTVSGEGREIKLDLRVCEFSIADDSVELADVSQPLGSHPALQLRFPNRAVCLVVPCRPNAGALDSRCPASGFGWLRNRLGRPAVQTSVTDPPIEPPAEPRVRRNLFVDVWHGQASIVEFVETGSGKTRIRRLKEQFLSRAERMHADRLKRQITYGENGGTYDVNGLYRPQTEPSLGELTQLVEKLERQDGPLAWDRRRYPR
jgi:hypothetical protein